MNISLALLLTLTTLFASCTSQEAVKEGLRLPVPLAGTGIKALAINPDSPESLDELVSKFSNKRVLFIGEVHDQNEHHQNQFTLIKKLYEHNPQLAIGAEFFQQPFQRYVDDYISGKIDERELLVKTEYFKRWKIDYRMLQPIIRFAKEKQLPVLALNISDEIHHKVFNDGIKSLTPEERALAPADIQPISEDYRKRLSTIFNTHPEGARFETFVEGQTLWDESMADVAATYLKEHPESKLVVLAGLGHMLYGDGIPRSLDRRLGGNESAVAINGYQFGEYPGIADFILDTSTYSDLPKAGKLGIAIDDSSGNAIITQLFNDGASKASGINLGDYIVQLDGISIATFPEIKSVMFDKKPGNVVSVTLLRKHANAKTEELNYQVTLR